MMKDIIITLIIGFIVFELIEHVVFPLFWAVKNRKKRSVCGAEGMFGKVVEIRQWNKTEGQVFVDGELWRAVSDVPLLTGGKAVIQNVEGLTLSLKPFND
ncbi:MAG: NfeD family protein [Deltaproteobacteria bacterium]|jgi:membrane-bound serine protease (ClpP class)|nr:NfeD family protein [Deltaproteobacteria bacterium]